MAETTYKDPTTDDIKEVAKKAGVNVTEEKAAFYARHLAGISSLFKAIADWPEIEETDVIGRDKGRPPTAEENTLNQWVWKCNVSGNGKGKLEGKTVGIKDSIAVAGIPMDAGNAGLVGYVPKMDAPVVSRILEAGGTIVGKLTCENLCYSAMSHTSIHGRVSNPHDPSRTSAGSSCGSAVAAALKQVDMALGTDTGGSVRMPSSICGDVGMKATFGLISTVGNQCLSPACDHVGPITGTVEDCALLLEAIAIPDNLLHPVRKEDRNGQDYTSGINQGIQGLKIAIIEEGFAETGSEEINKCVESMIGFLQKEGATFERVSVPEHKEAATIVAAVLTGDCQRVLEGSVQPYAGRAYSMLDMNRNYKDPFDNYTNAMQKFHLTNEYARQRYPHLNIAQKAINQMIVIRRQV